MLKVLIAKIKSWFTKPQVETIQPPVIDDVYISFFQTTNKYQSDYNQIEMYYRGMVVEPNANQWSLSILVSDILAAKYDFTIEGNDTPNLIRSIFNGKYNRYVEVAVDETVIVRIHFNFFDDHKKMAKFHTDINPFANDPAAISFMSKM